MDGRAGERRPGVPALGNRSEGPVGEDQSFVEFGTGYHPLQSPQFVGHVHAWRPPGWGGTGGGGIRSPQRSIAGLLVTGQISRVSGGSGTGCFIVIFF